MIASHLTREYFILSGYTLKCDMVYLALLYGQRHNMNLNISLHDHAIKSTCQSVNYVILL